VQDLTEAVRYFKLSVDQGNSNAQCHYGICVQNGEGVVQDLTEAVRYFKLSADQGKHWRKKYSKMQP
jgi:TPR repeat protein